jgi:signal transduction histidine kinase
VKNLNHPDFPYKYYKTGGSTDLAFAVVVLASYFAMFSSITGPNLIKLIIMVTLGIAYISIGIYGFTFCLKKNRFDLMLLYFIIQISIGSFIVYLGQGAGISAILLLPLAGHAVVIAPGYWLYLINGLIVAGYVFAVKFHSGNWNEVWTTIPTVLAGLIYIMVFTQMALEEEESRTKSERLNVELEEANKRLKIYADEVEKLTIIQERNRLAREIHDGLGHYLTTINMQLQAAHAILKTDPLKADDAIEKARIQSKLALIDVRKSVSALRFDSDKPENLNAMINKAIRPCEWAGIEPHFKIIGQSREITKTMQSTIFRIIQETVNNACKYSNAKNFYVNMDYSDSDKLVMSVSDDGLGAKNYEAGFGLLGLKERIELIDGKIEIQSFPSMGFQIGIELPYDKKD